MNREDIIRMALEVGLPHWYHTDGIVNEERVIAFAALIASAERERLTYASMKAAEKAVGVSIALEREACARVCDDIHAKYKWPQDTAEKVASQWCADAIRARGQA